MNSFGERVRALREQRGESIEALARALSVSTNTLWRHEVGKRNNPGRDLVVAVATHYEVTADYLLGLEAA